VLPARALGVAAEAELRDYFHLPVAGLERGVAELVKDKVLLPVALRGWACTRQPSPSAATAVLNGYQARAAEQSEASQPSDWTRLRLQFATATGGRPDLCGRLAALGYHRSST
jgi:uncharacterized protein YcaQ